MVNMLFRRVSLVPFLLAYLTNEEGPSRLHEKDHKCNKISTMVRSTRRDPECHSDIADPGRIHAHTDCRHIQAGYMNTGLSSVRTNAQTNK